MRPRAARRSATAFQSASGVEPPVCALTHPMKRLWHTADLLDQVLVATPIDGIFRKESHTVLAVCEKVVVLAGVISDRCGEDPVKGMIEGTCCW